MEAGRELRGLRRDICEQRDDGETFAIVTVFANELVTPTHDRMPLVLPGEVHQMWLFGEPDEAAR